MSKHIYMTALSAFAGDNKGGIDRAVRKRALVRTRR